MIFRRRSQKEISEKYQGNLDIYKKIQPWRLSRFLASFFAISIGIAAIIAFQKRGNEKFFNPGKLSRAHSNLADNCASCHGHPLDPEQLTQVNFKKTLDQRLHNGVDFGPIDQNCATCHFEISQRTYAFHEPNVIANRSCSVCHQEHRGAETMRIVASAQCASCHDDAAVMVASAEKGRGMDWKNFHRHPHPPQQIVFDLPRPPEGYTKTFAAFWDGHPQFQLKRTPVRDLDGLKFNHQRHFEADIPPVSGGQKLSCAFCHQPDSEGRYNNARITFAAQCQVCHSLQLDPKNPELTLPHGSTVAVHGFLHDLPSRYADLALQKGITQPNEIRTFVTRQMLQLRDRVRSGEDFEKQIFFVADPYKLQPGSDSRVRASFYGCALCHEVRPVANGAPSIQKPVFVDRWMPQAKFNHSSHTMVNCDDCHHATRSSATSDVLMPGIESCVTCHSPQGQVVASCITCHSYHAPNSLAVAQNGKLPGQP